MKFGRRAQAVRVSNIGTRTNTRGLAWLCLSCCKCICQIYPVACTTHSRTGGHRRHPARTRATSDNSRWPEPAGASHSRRILRSRSERSEQEPPPVLRSDSAHTSSVVALHIQQFNTRWPPPFTAVARPLPRQRRGTFTVRGRRTELNSAAVNTL